MSTRSTISILNKDNSIESSFCHWDGYISNNGAKLFLYYQDTKKIKTLISLGAISSLHKNISPSGHHDYDNREKDVTVFYGRDCGNSISDIQSSKFKDINDYVQNCEFQEYDYIYKEKTKKWYVFDTNKKIFKNLKKLVREAYNDLNVDLKNDFNLLEKSKKQEITKKTKYIIKK